MSGSLRIVQVLHAACVLVASTILKTPFMAPPFTLLKVRCGADLHT